MIVRRWIAAALIESERYHVALTTWLANPPTARR